MATKNVYRHRITAKIDVDIEYDPKQPITFQAALDEVEAKRKALIDLGADLTVDDGKPVAVRTAE